MTHPDDQSATNSGHDDEREDGLTVSEAGSSFSGSETSGGGADAVPSTPDSVPVDNHEDNKDLVGEDDLLA
ncbi:MAG: hypothetical protein M3Y71_05610 [Actinomycetota bacterium]|nr:hypothetical protein [Actinomycetota bacterium]